MSFVNFLRRRNKEKEELEGGDNGFHEVTNSEKETPNHAQSSSMIRNENEYVQWSKVFFDSPEITRAIDESVSWANIAAQDIYNCYSKIISTVFSYDAPRTYLRELIRFITVKLFKKFAVEFQFNPNSMDECLEDEIDFRKHFACALYYVCDKYDLDFNEIFGCIKDIPTYEDDEHMYTFEWSFGDFVEIPEHDEFFTPADEMAYIEEACGILETLFSENFDSFIICAFDSDIDDLVRFGIKYEAFFDLDIFESICDSILDREDIKVRDLDVIKAITSHYPGITVQAITSYLYALLYYPSTNDNVELPIDEIIDAFVAIEDLHEYRSEEFFDLASNWEFVLESCLVFYDGVVVSAACEMFNKSFGVCSEELDEYIRYHVSNLIYDDLDAYKILNISKLLSNRSAFEYIYANKPAIIQALS